MLSVLFLNVYTHLYGLYSIIPISCSFSRYNIYANYYQFNSIFDFAHTFLLWNQYWNHWSVAIIKKHSRQPSLICRTADRRTLICAFTIYIGRLHRFTQPAKWGKLKLNHSYSVLYIAAKISHNQIKKHYVWTV